MEVVTQVLKDDRVDRPQNPQLIPKRFCLGPKPMKTLGSRIGFRIMKCAARAFVAALDGTTKLLATKLIKRPAIYHPVRSFEQRDGLRLPLGKRGHEVFQF